MCVRQLLSSSNCRTILEKSAARSGSDDDEIDSEEEDWESNDFVRRKLLNGISENIRKVFDGFAYLAEWNPRYEKLASTLTL